MSEFFDAENVHVAIDHAASEDGFTEIIDLTFSCDPRSSAYPEFSAVWESDTAERSSSVFYAEQKFEETFGASLAEMGVKVHLNESVTAETEELEICEFLGIEEMEECQENVLKDLLSQIELAYDGIHAEVDRQVWLEHKRAEDEEREFRIESHCEELAEIFPNRHDCRTRRRIDELIAALRDEGF